MKRNFENLEMCPLFLGIEKDNLESMLGCLNAKFRKYEKGEVIFASGEIPKDVGVVLKGKVQVVQDDFWGNRRILFVGAVGEIFGESFACAHAKELPVSVIAHEDVEVLIVDVKKILTTCSAACVFHTLLIENLVTILAEKNMGLTGKMEHITKKTTREKVLSYLSQQAKKSGRSVFDIPFNRQELADFLAVERSALSACLSKMKEEGVVDFHKNHFQLL